MLILSLSFLIAVCFCDRLIVENIYERQLKDYIVNSLTVQERFYRQRLDHFDPLSANQTFMQRYYIDESFSRGPETPIFCKINV